MPPPEDPLIDETRPLLAELRERCAAPGVGERPEELLIEGYAAALKLEGARRRLREQALEAAQRELTLAAQEQELRAQLRALRERLAIESRVDGGRRAQLTSPRRSA